MRFLSPLLFALIPIFVLTLVGFPTQPLHAEDSHTSSEAEELIDLLEDVDVEAFSEGEIIEESEPTELPEALVDRGLTERLRGRLLLEVEGKGEVYYVDPETGEKEYLADGEAAHALLRRRALGITTANLETIPIGEEASDASVCDVSTLAKRLRGRILLEVESHGEAWYVYPENCRRYYVGTFDRAYEVMKRLSLGIKTEHLAKIADTKRDHAKLRLRILTHVYVMRHGLTLEEARVALVEQIQAVRTCVQSALASANDELVQDRLRAALKIGIIRRCLEATDVPIATTEERIEARAELHRQRRGKAEDTTIQRETEHEEEVEVEVEEETEREIEHATLHTDEQGIIIEFTA